jgi:hypothetical protein
VILHAVVGFLPEFLGSGGTAGQVTVPTV